MRTALARLWAKIKETSARFRASIKKQSPYFIIGLLLVLLFIAYFFNRIFITIHSGEAGVLYNRFDGGTRVDRVYDEELYIVAPWNIMAIYNIRIQEVSQDVQVLTEDGLAIKIRAALRFRPPRKLLGVLHKHHGPNYVESYLLPELGSSIRRVIGLITPAELYATQRDSIEKAIFRHLNGELREIDEDINIVWPHQAGASGNNKWPNEQHVLPNIRSPELRARALEVGLSALSDSLIAVQDSVQFEYNRIREQYEKVKNVLDGLTRAARRAPGTGRPGGVQTLLDSLRTEYDIFRSLADSLAGESRRLGNEYKNIQADSENVLAQYDSVYLLIDIHDVLIENIELPPAIQTAIQKKLEQEQVVQEFDFRLQTETKEAERKRIEAQGIKDFQDIVTEGISENLLRWKAIQATLELAKSENAKIVIIGAGEDGLPIILGNIDQSQ